MVPLSDNHMNSTSPRFILLHLCPNKPFILQQAAAGKVYLHSPSTAVSSYLTAYAPKSPCFCLEINLLDIWFSKPLFPVQLTAFWRYTLWKLIHTTTTNRVLLLGERCGAFVVAFFWIWNKKLHWEKQCPDKGYKFMLHNWVSNSSLAPSASSVCSVASHLHHWI